MREELPVAWEKLPTKALEVENETTPLILGKGNKTGVELWIAFIQNKADRHKLRAPSYQRPTDRPTDQPTDRPTKQLIELRARD